MKSSAKVSLLARGLNLRLGDTQVLSELTLAVEPGELLALLGPSGSGKSSLLRAIAGFVAPQSGEILIDGEDVARAAPERRGVGMVFQNYALWPHLNVRENVAFGLIERRVERAVRRERVDAMLQAVGLSEFAGRMPATLSGGQQQRVALARTLVTEPRVLLLDEPFSNLDPQLRVQVRQELRNLQRALGLTTVFVTHDQEEAMTIADRVAVLEGGVLQQVGTPAALFDFPANRFVAGFLGTANLLDGQVTCVEGDWIRFDAAGLGLLSLPRSPQFTVRPGPATLAFRPHQVALKVRDEQVEPGRLWLEGVVRSSEFMGVFSRHRIDLGTATLVADQPHYSGLAMFPVGARVRLGIDPAQVRFLHA